MIGLLLQIFASLLVAMVLSLGMGLLLGRRPSDAANEHLKGTQLDIALLEEVVTREADLIERLSRAEDDLRAHAVELADANEEITCLLDHLHEARSTGSAQTNDRD